MNRGGGARGGQACDWGPDALRKAQPRRRSACLPHASHLISPPTAQSTLAPLTDRHRQHPLPPTSLPRSLMISWLPPLSRVAKRLRAMNTAAAEKPRLASCEQRLRGSRAGRAKQADDGPCAQFKRPLQGRVVQPDPCGPGCCTNAPPMPATPPPQAHRRHLATSGILGHSEQLIGAALHVGLHQHRVLSRVVGQGTGACRGGWLERGSGHRGY